MIRTHGLTHLALRVRDVERSLRFYHALFGARVTHREKGWIEVQTPGAKDFLTFEAAGKQRMRSVGKSGGIAHFGFRFRKPEDIETIARAVKAEGGKVLRKGEFSKGHPYVFFQDPDGYEVEVWFE